MNPIAEENFSKVAALYNHTMSANVHLHDLIYPEVFGEDQYIGQFSDNSKDELLFMGKLMDLPKKSQVLDVGCGRGRVANLMANHFSWDVTGIDLSLIPIRNAQEFDQSKVKFIHGNIYEYAFSHLFSGIFGTGAFCHFNALNLFERCNVLLQRKGRLAFMERVRQGDIRTSDWKLLTEDWCCPSVYTKDEYMQFLKASGFRVIHAIDLTPSFRVWQARSVLVRESLKEMIIQNSSPDYYNASLNFAKYENDVTQDGYLGYICIVAEKE